MKIIKLFKDLKNILNFANKGISVLISLTVLNSFLEVFSIASVIPMINIMIDDTPDSRVRILFEMFFNKKIQFYELLTYSSLIIIFCFLLKSIFQIIFIKYKNSFIFDLNEKLTNKLFQIYLYQDYKFIYENTSSLLIRNITSEVNNVVTILNALISFFVSFLLLIFAFVFLLFINLNLTIILSFLLIILSLFFYKLTKNINLRYGKIKQVESGNLLKSIQNTFYSFKEVKLMFLEKMFEKEIQEVSKNFFKSFKVQSFLSGIPRILIELSIIIIFCISILFFVKEGFDAKNIVVTFGIFVLVAGRLLPMFPEIINSFQIIKFNTPSLDLIKKELQNLKYELEEKRDLFKKPEFNNIKFDNVSFGYAKDKKVIRNFNFTFVRGKKYFIKGVSGKGKSTILDLFSGLLKPQEGKILIDGKDIFENIFTIRNLISYVPQNVSIINETLLKNITFQNESDVDYSLLERALNIAQLNSMIDKLPHGKQTFLGEKGLLISGGERQRIGIARAIYKNSQIYILDEATNSIDKNIENKILSQLINQMNITLLFTSHHSNYSSFDIEEIEL